MTVFEILPSLESVHARGQGRWSARCPAHADKSPSLSVMEGDRGILLKCFAGCRIDEITSALGLRVADLFTDVVREDACDRFQNRCASIAEPWRFGLSCMRLIFVYGPKGFSRPHSRWTRLYGPTRIAISLSMQLAGPMQIGTALRSLKPWPIVFASKVLSHDTMKG